MSNSSEHALILFGHGARDAAWATPFHQLKNKLLQAQPDIAVACAFLELMSPTLPEAVASLIAAKRRLITIAPIFIAQGGHLKNDLAEMLQTLRAQNAGIEFTLLPALGESDAVLNGIAQWLLKEIE